MLRIHQFSDILLESVIGTLVVFVALTLLVVAFNLLAKVTKKSVKLPIKNTQPGTETQFLEKEITGEEMAAISLALHFTVYEMHDEESNIITIKNIERRYSPWNSKIYGLNNLNK